jgi:hypothetical protein
MSNHKLIDELFEVLNLEESGFKLIPGMSNESEVYFEKRFNKSIGILFFSFTKVNYVYGIGGYLYLSQIEEILQPLLVKYGLEPAIQKFATSLVAPIDYSESSIKILNEVQKTTLLEKSFRDDPSELNKNRLNLFNDLVRVCSDVV